MKRMKIGVAYALPHRQVWLTTEVPDGATVRQAVEHSGLLECFPQLALEQHKLGIFGKFTALDAPVQDGDRIEIYRPLLVDPKTVPKKRKATTGPAPAANGAVAPQPCPAAA
ncbi:MAG TPA: RnfH family protein [Rhodocyclaceae bacterium]|nr:RnfH family protein [Rhodocyclaceae bacterium]